MHLPMCAMMLFGGAEKGARINVPGDDRVSALILADAFAGTPIVKAAILNDWPQMQKMRMGSGNE